MSEFDGMAMNMERLEDIGKAVVSEDIELLKELSRH